MRTVLGAFFLFCISIVLHNCATTPVQEEPPPPPAVYRFEFSAPERAQQKMGMTIGIVSPKWDEKISGNPQTGKVMWLDAGINPIPDELLRHPGLEAHVGPAPMELNQIALAFTNAVRNEFEAMMVAKGFGTMGPFAKVDDMTYPQKTTCNVIIVPEFSQIVRSQPSSVIIDQIQGRAVIRTEIVLNIFEPLSMEKFWMKRFTTDSKPFSYRVLYNAQYAYDQSGKMRIGVQRTGVRWDNRPTGFAQGYTELFKEIMEKSWAYFTPEEIKILKKHSDDLREKKRF